MSGTGYSMTVSPDAFDIWGGLLTGLSGTTVRLRTMDGRALDAQVRGMNGGLLTIQPVSGEGETGGGEVSIEPTEIVSVFVY